MRYAEIVRDTIRDWGFADVNNFLEKLKPNQGRPALSYIRVNGFRRGSEGEYQRQRVMLARRLTADGADQPATDRDWGALAHLWVVWVGTAFDDADLIAKVKSCMRDQNDSQEIIEGIVERLGYLGKERLASREHLETFVRFAPFQLPDDFSFDDLLANAVDSEGLEEAKIARALPQKVIALEQRVAELSQEADNLSRLSGRVNEEARTVAEHDSRLQRISEHYDVLDSQFRLAVAKIAELSDSAKSSKRSEDDSKQTLASLTQTLARACQRVDELEKQFADTSGKLESLESRPLQIPQESGPRIDADRTVAAANALATRLCTQFGDNTVGVADDLGSSYLALRDNLSALGLLKESAEQVASEVIAGVGTDQLISFSGNVSLLVAQICAISVAGPEITILDVPLGLSDAVLFDAATSDVDVILNNANVGSFDVYATSICAQVVESQFSRTPKAQRRIRFATLAAPPIGLPQEVFSQLGPVIDTDLLSWGESSFRKPINATKSTIVNTGDNNEARDFWLDLNECLESAGKPRNELWRRVIMNAYALLQALPPSGTADPSSDLSILASWIVPYWRARGMSGKAITEMLAKDSAFVAAIGSARLTAMLGRIP